MNPFLSLIPLIIGVFCIPVLEVFFVGGSLGSIFISTAVLIFEKEDWGWMEYCYLIVCSVLIDSAMGFTIGTYGFAIILSFFSMYTLRLFMAADYGLGKIVMYLIGILVFHAILAQININLINNLSIIAFWGIIRSSTLNLVTVLIFEKLRSKIWIPDSNSIKF